MTKEMQALALRDNAKAELLQIKSIETGREYLNKLKSIETWVRAEKKDAELQNIIAEQKLRTQRILGDLIKKGQEDGQIATSDNNKGQFGAGGNTEIPPQNLEDLGITKNQSSTFKSMASIPEEKFEAWIQESKQKVNDAVNELTTRGALRLAGKYKQSYDEEMRITGYLNRAYANKFRAYMHYKGMDMSELVVAAVRSFLDSVPQDQISAMNQSYLSSLKLDQKR